MYSIETFKNTREVISKHVGYLSAIKKEEKANSWISYPHEQHAGKKSFGAPSQKGEARSCHLMKRIFHFRRGGDIKNVLRSGRRVETPLVSVLFARQYTESPRYAFIASRAIDKRAVVRNRLRRRAREWFRKRDDFKKNHCDIVMIFKKAARDVPRAALYSDFEEIALRILSVCGG